MRKAFLLVIACAVASLVVAQNATIIVDKVNDDGSRVIGTNTIMCRNGMADRHPMGFAVTRYSEGDRVALSIAIDLPSMSSFKISKGGMLLIKLADNSIIELHNETPTENTQDIVGKYDTYTKLRTHTMHASYEVTTKQMEQIVNSEIKKIRLETAAETFDAEYKKDKVTPALRSQYQLVLRTAQQKKDLRSDF